MVKKDVLKVESVLNNKHDQTVNRIFKQDAKVIVLYRTIEI